MSSERYLRLKRILLAARDVPQTDRAAFLERECGGDVALRDEVASLLSHEDRLPDIVRTGGPAQEASAGLAGVPSHPERIAAYRILEVLGVGGMGVVYRAEQTEPIRREVALKRIRHGMPTEQVIARFEAERQSLALMDHPNIAKVLDAGAGEDGQPFFVMELVRGEPINRYSESNRLSMEERLRLFIPVCRAVEHAHRKGIIHRDLKPSNILITEPDGNPTPKVIDFGIAVVLEEPQEGRSLHTEFGQLVGTPQYMSPEQATEPGYMLDTRTDVYSLGVVLYELLTGAHPYDTTGSSVIEVVRIIREEPPAALRKAWTSESRLDPDLETIVSKALEKEPDSRYPGAAALADDIERLLARQPILARPPSTAYQLRKLVARHRVAFAFATTMFAFLVVFAVTMSVLYGAQRRERERAEQEALKAERINEFLQTMLASVDPTIAQGHEVTVRDVLAAAAADVESTLVDQPEIRAAVQTTLGNTYRSLGDYSEAEPLLRAALAEREQVLGSDHLAVADVQRDLAELLIHTGSYTEAGSLGERALATRRHTLGNDDPDVADVINDLGVVAYYLGDYETTVERWKESLAIRRRVLAPDHEDIGEALGNLAVVTEQLGDRPGAEPYYRESIEIIRSRLGPDHPNYGTALNNLAVNLKLQGKLDEAEVHYREGLDVRRRAFGDDHRLVLSSLNNLGRLLHAKGDLAGADSVLRACLAARRRTLGDRHLDTAESASNLAILCQERGLVSEAERLFREAISTRRGVRPDHPTAAISLAYLGELFIATGRFPEAETCLREAVAIRERHYPPNGWRVAYTRSLLAHAIALGGRHAEAEPLLLESLDVVIDSNEMKLSDKRTVVGRVVALYEGWGRPAEADRYRGYLSDQTANSFPSGSRK